MGGWGAVDGDKSVRVSIPAWLRTKRARQVDSLRGPLMIGLCYRMPILTMFHRMVVRTLPLICAILLIAPTARADWQYTHWGMTPEQVVAASKGTAHLLPEKDRPRLPPFVTAAQGEYSDGPLQLRATFLFNIATNGLACVSYGVSNHVYDDALKAALTKQYGPPKTTAGPAFLGMTTLSWKTPTDQIELTLSKDDPAYAKQCSLKK
jgi:hypothetical protein